MECPVWYMLLIVGVWQFGAWLWDPREGFDMVYATLSRGRRTYSLGPDLEVWLVGAGIYCIGV